jgi:ribose transport system substrate-binding protein
MKLSIGLFSFSALALLCVGCSSPAGQSSDSTVATPNASDKKKLKLAFVTNNSSDFWTIARKGVEKADAELENVETEFKMPTAGTAEEQRAILEVLSSAGVDGIAISPKDPANQTEILNAAAAKTVLITQDSDAPNSNRLCYIGTDNVAAGKQAGEELLKALPSGGKVVAFVGSKDAQNAKERLQGIQEAITGSKVELVDVRTDETDRAKAKSNVADTILAKPDVAALVGIWSYNGPAIYGAVKDAGKIGKIKIVCFDEEDDTLKGVAEGAIEGTVVQQPYEFGYQSIKKMSEYLGGNKGTFPAEKKIIVPTKVVKKDSVAEFSAKLKELRGK